MDDGEKHEEWDPDSLNQTLLNREQTEQWVMPANLDAFFLKVYSYYIEKGFWPIVVSQITNLITVGFTILFSTFLMLLVNWRDIFSCSSQDTCKEVDLVKRDVFASVTFGEVLVMFYFTIFSLYWLWHFLSFFYVLRDGIEMRHFFNRKLGIQDDDLTITEWHEVLEKVVKIQETLKLCIVKDLTTLDITNRILRKENYMVAFFNLDLLDFSLPFFCQCRWNPSYQIPKEIELQNRSDVGVGSIQRGNTRRLEKIPLKATTKTPPGWIFLGQTLDWNVRFCILNSMFDSNFEIRKGFLSETGVLRLQRRFVILGILNLVLLPFVMIFMVIVFVLKNAEELQKKKTFLGPRVWTPLARWKMREFNELPHFFERRLNLSMEPAQKYISQFPSPLTSILANCVTYIAGAVVGVLALLTLSDSSVLINLRLGDRALLWYLAIFSAVLALSRSFIPEKETNFKPQEVMDEVVQYTHYFPRRWQRRVHTHQVKEEFGALYKARVLVFLDEILSAIFTPLILCFSMPNCVPAIVSFVKNSTVNVKGVGQLCGYAKLDLSTNGDPLYNLKTATVNSNDTRDSSKKEKELLHDTTSTPYTTGYQPISDNPPLQKTTPQQLLGKAKQGKLEKSLINFAINHPNWKTDPSASRFLAVLTDCLAQQQKEQQQQQTSEKENLARSRTLQSPKTKSTGDELDSIKKEKKHKKLSNDESGSDEDEVGDNVSSSTAALDTLSPSNFQLISSFTDSMLGGSTGHFPDASVLPVMSASLSDLTSAFGINPKMTGSLLSKPDTRDRYAQDQSLLNLFNVLEQSVQLIEQKEKHSVESKHHSSGSSSSSSSSSKGGAIISSNPVLEVDPSTASQQPTYGTVTGS